MSQREALLEATERLIWKVGFEAMSPKAILRESGAGQGSMYHHFQGKKDLAIQAMERHERLLWERTERLLMSGGSGGPMARVDAWLGMAREPLGGCRLGRLANEDSIRTDPELRAPLDRYFSRVHGRLTELLEEAQVQGEMEPSLKSAHVASALVAVVQGGYVLAMGTGEASHLHQAVGATRTLLALAGGSVPTTENQKETQ